MSFYQQFFADVNAQSPLTYIDVGAMGGLSSYWKGIAPSCRIIAFEPDEREFAKLASSKTITYLPYALYHSSQSIRFFVSRDQGKSSIYPPNMALLENFPDAARYETVDEVVFPKEKVTTLDEALAQAKIKHADFIKLDTQGSELDILKGAGNSLRHLCGIEIEVEFVPLYQGQPLFRDVDAFLDAQGFQLMDLRRASWKQKSFADYIGRGQLVFGDALYLRKIDVFLNMLSADNTDVPSKIAKAAIVAMIYRLPDYACALIDQALAKKLIEQNQHGQWIAAIKNEASSWGMPHLPGRSIFAKIANRCAEALRPASYLGWADGDRHIGNTRNI